jgi:hypothetical protein
MTFGREPEVFRGQPRGETRTELALEGLSNNGWP